MNLTFILCAHSYSLIFSCFCCVVFHIFATISNCSRVLIKSRKLDNITTQKLKKTKKQRQLRKATQEQQQQQQQQSNFRVEGD